jgi:hypothetical protein
MDPIFQEFEQDLARVVCQLELIEKIGHPPKAGQPVVDRVL